LTPATNVPPSRREDVVDHYHGTPVADPYRWLEDGEAAEVVEWVAAQNAVTRSILDADPARPVWHRLLVEAMERPVVQAVERRGGALFCSERPHGAEQFVLTRRSAIDPAAPPVVLLDPGALSADAATAVDWYEPSADGSLIAVGVSEGGSEHSTLRVLSGVDGAPAGVPELDDIPDTRAASVAWEPDGRAFFYTRYPEGDAYHRTVFHHRLGTPWADDPVVWAEHPDPQAWPNVALSDDGRWLLVGVEVGWRRADVHLLDRESGRWHTVIAGVEAATRFRFSADATALVGITTLDAGRGRVVRVPLDVARIADGPGAWETLVAENDAVATALGVTSQGLVMVTTRGAVDSLWRLDADGRPLDTGPLDTAGRPVTVDQLATSSAHGDWFAVVNSFEAPPALWRVAADGLAAPALDPDATLDLAVTETSYRSPDGTEVGLFLVHRADVTPSPGTPTILNGYGGFAISRGPAWQPRLAAWCLAGGLFAVAGLRGGAEHGDAWHEAGRRASKQNVFDDFHAAADFLVASGLTSREHLAVLGGSNGGLLVGAALTQRPDLCAAVVCAVPLLDMVRFPNFLIARLWTDEYGDPDVADEFAWLHAYSPYHHVVEGRRYPATLLLTAEGDSRVDPLHARKMAAMLQWAAADQDRRPVLLSQEGRAGHGVGKPVHKLADSVADELTFAGAHTGLRPAGTDGGLRPAILDP